MSLSKKYQKNIGEGSHVNPEMSGHLTINDVIENTSDLIDSSSNIVDAVVKIGGSTLGDHDTTINDLVKLYQIG